MLKMRRLHDTAQFERHVLSNGIVVWMQGKAVQTDYCGHLSVFLPDVGSVLEPKGKRGLAHFLEHMPFLGTEITPDCMQNTGRIINNGGKTNAGTGTCFTYFFVEMPQEDAEIAAQALSEFVTCPILNKQNVDSEKRIILREYEEKMEGEYRLDYDSARAIFGNGPLGILPVGIKEDIESIVAEDLKNFFLKYYHAGNMQLVCGGSFSYRDDMLEMLEKKFGDIRRGECVSQRIKMPSILKKGFKKVLYDEKYVKSVIDVVHFSFGLSYREKQAFNFLMENLSSSFESPLYKALRLNDGKVYKTELTSFVGNKHFCGANFSCRIVGEEPQYYIDTYKKVLEELDPQYVMKCKHTEQLRRLISFQHPINACKAVPGEVHEWGRPISYTEFENVRDSLTVDDIMSARDYLLQANPVVICCFNGSNPA